MLFFFKKRKNRPVFKNNDIFIENMFDSDRESYTELKFKTRTKKLYTALKILSAANIIIFILIILLFYFNTENNRKFNSIIFKADRCIDAGDFVTAEGVLKNALEFSKTKKNSLILLKRYFTVSNNLKNYQNLENISEILYSDFKRDYRIKKIYLYSLLKTQNIKKFFDVFPFKTEKDSFLNNLLLQAYSEYISDNYDFKLNRRINDFFRSSIYFDLLNDKMNIDKYLKAYETDRNSAFLNNYIILLMNKGLRSDAYKYSLIRNKRDILSAFVLLDNRKYPESIEILSDIPEKSIRLKLILADIEMYLSNPVGSRIIYKDIYSKDPLFSNIPLINLIWLDYTEKGIINNNHLSELLNSYSSSNINNLLFFINMQKLYKNTDEMNLISGNDLIDLFNINNSNQNKYIEVLWSFFNNYSTDNSFKKYFLYYLLKNEKYRDLSILLDKEEVNNNPYFYLFKSFYDIKMENYSSAERNLKEYLSNNRCWEVFYNTALINIKNGNYTEAVKYLDIVLKSSLCDEDISDVYFWKAYSLYRSRKYREAFKVIDKSAVKNRSNIEAKFLRNHIKSKIVES